jgi:hypothetical protein
MIIRDVTVAAEGTAVIEDAAREDGGWRGGWKTW